MHENGEFSKVKGSICNVPIEAANICNILPRPSVSNGLIFFNLKWKLKYRGHLYFKPSLTNYLPSTYLFEIS